jgi:molybdopterin-guanine dinucleotide biosynthesis protein A
MKPEDIIAVILSGGKSSRLGTNKAFLQFKNVSFIEVIIEKLLCLFNKVIISTKEPIEYLSLLSPATEIVADGFKVQSSLVGIYSALQKSPTKYIFVIAVDMPTIQEGLIKRLLKYYRKYDVVIPETPKGLEPLCAIYSKNCLKYIARQIKDNNHKIIDFFDKVRIKIILLKTTKLFNINTRKDYKGL